MEYTNNNLFSFNRCNIFSITKEDFILLNENITSPRYERSYTTKNNEYFVMLFYGILLDQREKTNEQCILFVRNIDLIVGFIEKWLRTYIRCIGIFLASDIPLQITNEKVDSNEKKREHVEFPGGITNLYFLVILIQGNGCIFIQYTFEMWIFFKRYEIITS